MLYFKLISSICLLVFIGYNAYMACVIPHEKVYFRLILILITAIIYGIVLIFV